MRVAAIRSTLRDVFRQSRRELTSLLLWAAVLAPLSAAALGWPLTTPLAEDP